jgi:hypothetical protein
MATSASARHHLFRTLESVLGDEDAATLMDHLPEGGWEEVATKSDLRALGSELRGEMVALRSELKADIAELRSQVVPRQELTEIIDLHIDARMGAIARQWTIANVAMNATMLAAVIAAIRL